MAVASILSPALRQRPMTRFLIGTAVVCLLLLAWVLAVAVTGNLSLWLSRMLP